MLALAEARQVPLASIYPPRSGARKGRVTLNTICSDLAERLKGEGLTPSESIDAILQDEHYLAAWNDRGKGRTSPRFVPIPSSWIPTNLRWAGPIWSTLQAAVKLSNHIGSTIDSLGARGTNLSLQVTTPEEIRRADPSWYLRDPILPDEVVDGILGEARQHAARCAVAGLIHRKGYRDTTLALELAKIWESEMRRHFRLIASFPEANISEADVPAAERFDMNDAYARQRKTLEGLLTA